MPSEDEEEAEPQPEPRVEQTSSKPSKKRGRKESSVTGPGKRHKAAEPGGAQSKVSGAVATSNASALADVEKKTKLHDEWRSHRLEVQKLVALLKGPDDGATLGQLRTEVNRLSEINEALTQ